MNKNHILQQISALPKGGITYKTINNKKYAYYQWRENGKQHSRRIKDEELIEYTYKINQRKELENIVKEIDSKYIFESVVDYNFSCLVRVNEDLYSFVKPVKELRKRSCFKDLYNYIYEDKSDKVFILYGLRRTGKTTLIRQIIEQMSDEMKALTAFVQVSDKTTMADINRDLKYLENNGYKYVFIDEVTLMDDFISGGALFSDIYASSGMKIVLSGTDSLGFMLSIDEELYDRSIMLHTTFIPYKEFEDVLGIKGVDKYIQYGGTMSISGENYNVIFKNKDTVDEYVNSAIAHNIQHSLKNYQDEGHFRALKELYDKKELTNVINRVVEDINHRFTLDVLTREFKSNDLALSARNLRKDRNNPTDILDNVDKGLVTSRLKEMLDIIDKDDQKIELKEEYISEIKEYLSLLDLIVEVEVRGISTPRAIDRRIIFSQPGLRYAQVEALVNSLVEDELFSSCSIIERTNVINRILSEVKGRMIEDIVLLETQLSRSDCEVFKLQFAIGEFDMVVFNRKNLSCEIYEVKHSNKKLSQQTIHLRDSKKCEDTEFRYGTITGKYVIYNGESGNLEDIVYINVEEYLKSLH